MLTATDLKSLVPSAKAGDKLAMEQLCQSFTPLVKRLSHRQTVYNVLGEEAENTIWLLFLEFINQYSGDKYRLLPGLVRRYLILQTMNIIKHSSFRFNLEQLSEMDGECSVAQLPSPNNVQDVLNKLALWQELKNVPSQQRKILYAFYFKERTTNEIAVNMELTPRTVRYHRQEGLNNLRQRL